MNNRRKLVVAIGTTLSLPQIALGQAKNSPVMIGWLNTGSREAGERNLAAFKEGMSNHGLKEGTSYVLEERWANGRLDRVASLATELAAQNPVLIVAAPGRAALEANKVSPRTPIVQASGDSPVMRGLAKSLARPSGMVTGLTTVAIELASKGIELLLAAAPKLKRIGVLVDAASDLTMGVEHSRRTSVEQSRRAADHYGVEVRFSEAAKSDELEGAFAYLVKERVQGLVIRPSAWFVSERARIVKLALAQQWPTITVNRAFVEEGALLSYGVDTAAQFRRAAYYVERLLKGAKPGDLPIEQPMNFEMTVNLKTAKALGITLPPEIMVQVTRVIQ